MKETQHQPIYIPQSVIVDQWGKGGKNARHHPSRACVSINIIIVTIKRTRTNHPPATIAEKEVVGAKIKSEKKDP